MSEVDGRGRPTKLSAETKWEIFLQVTTGEITRRTRRASGLWTCPRSSGSAAP